MVPTSNAAEMSDWSVPGSQSLAASCVHDGATQLMTDPSVPHSHSVAASCVHDCATHQPDDAEPSCDPTVSCGVRKLKDQHHAARMALKAKRRAEQGDTVNVYFA